MESSLPLHVCHVQKLSIFINRSHVLLHFLAITFLIHYRTSNLFLFQEPKTRTTLLWLLVFFSELILAFIWLLGQAYRWRPVYRKVFPERLPEDDKLLPAVDVFICTADPKNEPTVDVMNTVISALTLDYPADKLHVYLSDDGGAPVTLHGTREAWKFARFWVPFCKKYGIKTICPKAYFSKPEDEFVIESDELVEDRRIIQEKYEDFKESITRFSEDHLGPGDTNNTISGRDHPAVIEVINANLQKDKVDHEKMPLLVYVSREKRPSYPHNFKAGALNVLLRVSGLISNSDYILVLDCDMYCNDPSSARQAMCFHLDSTISSSLSFVQFPQKFHNISKHDIYDSQLRSAFGELWQGLDGLRGPILSGCNFYIKRNSLYGNFIHKGNDFEAMKDTFGSSNQFIKSLGPQNDRANNVRAYGSYSDSLLQEAKTLSTCHYPTNTKWGKEVGFLYQSVVEDAFTGFILHCRGWTSVYLNPPRPQFLGTGITNLSDLLFQGTRWSCGLVEIGLSKFSPLIYGPRRMSFLQSLCYAEISLFPLCYCVSLWCIATIPQLALINGISLYPKVTSSSFLIFSFIFLSSLLKHLYEVVGNGGTIKSWVYEHRGWMMKSVSSSTFATINAVAEMLGMREASFMPTNKAEDDEKSNLYQMGMFDFRAPTMLLVPMVTVIILNLTSFLVGVVRIVVDGNCNEMLVQVFMSFYILAMNFAVIEGMVIRKDKGRIASSVTLLSIVFSLIFLCLGSIFLMYLT